MLGSEPTSMVILRGAQVYITGYEEKLFRGSEISQHKDLRFDWAGHRQGALLCSPLRWRVSYAIFLFLLPSGKLA
jgi:hypothetical protein